MKTTCKLTIIFSMLAYSFDCFAGVNTAAFLNIGVGARALGMGGAFTAIADDASSAYWNPAGLGLMKRISIGSMIQQIGSVSYPTLKDIAPDYQYVNLTVPLNKLMVPDDGTVSLGFISNSLNNIPFTTVSSGGSIVRQNVSDTENAYMVAYGRQMLLEELSLGASLKYVSQTISVIPDGSASGYGYEIGAHYAADEFLRFGLVSQSGVVMSWDNGHTDYGTMRNKAGAAYRVLNTQKLSLLTSLDIIQIRKYPIEAHLGAELDCYTTVNVGEFMLSKISLRTGVNGIAVENRYGMQGRMNQNLNWTLGVGFNIHIMRSALSLDYAMGSTALGDRHRISFSLYF